MEHRIFLNKGNSMKSIVSEDSYVLKGLYMYLGVTFPFKEIENMECQAFLLVTTINLLTESTK